MFRKFLSLSAGVLALLCITGIPGQVSAAGIRGGFRPGVAPQVRPFSSGFNRRFVDPRFGGFGPGFSGFSPSFDRRFMDPR